jgi:hypothetical protein
MKATSIFLAAALAISGGSVFAASKVKPTVSHPNTSTSSTLNKSPGLTTGTSINSGPTATAPAASGCPSRVSNSPGVGTRPGC